MPLDQLKAASNKAIGTKQVLKAIESEEASLVFVAQDADAQMIMSLKRSCEKHSIKFVVVSSKTQLGQACGIDVGAASAAILRA